MQHAKRYACLLSAIHLMTASAGAQGIASRAHLIDDSLTQAPLTQFRWRDPSPSGHTSKALFATSEVRVVLNVQQWAGRQARIYLRLAPQSPTNTTIEWPSGAIFVAGRLAAGQRQVVYEGRIASPLLRDILRLTVDTDVSSAASIAKLNLLFEIEAEGV